MQPIVDQPGLGPRAMAFITKSHSTKTQILESVLNIFKTDQALPPAALIERRVTQANQAELSNLDLRTKRLFQGIVADVYLDICQTKPDFLKSLMMLSQSVQDPLAHAKIVKEAALPHVKELVAELDRDFPNLIDEAASQPLPPLSQQIVTMFQL